jgi:hypothetical protein
MVSAAMHRAAFLVGRLQGYRRGNLSIANVMGAVRAARTHGVPASCIASLLKHFDLDWDRESDTVKVRTLRPE